MALELWIPETAREAEIPRKVLRCLMCGLELPHDHREQFERHVGACARKHEGEIDEAVAKFNESVFNRPADQERFDWIKEREERNETDVDYFKEGLMH